MRWLPIPLFLAIHLLTPISSADVSCPRVPEKCSCKVSKNLIVLECDGVEVRTIAQSIGTNQIDELHISNGTDVKIDSLPFTGLRTISILNFTLESTSPSAWRHVESTIEHITFNGNRLRSVPIFGNMTTLMSMNLNSNQISSIPEKAFNGLSALTQLRLEDNKICDFPTKSLDAVKQSLVLLDVSGNCLDSIPAQILRNAANLMYLDLGSNNISEINNFELMNLPFLRELRVQNNALRRIHPMLPSLKDLPNLKQVRVDGNLIAKIDTLAFSNNPKLQLISIQNNNIVQISRNAFDSLDKLVVLLVGNNTLAKIVQRGMFDGMKNLQQLSIRNNTLTALDGSSFAQLPHLTTLDLGYNKIQKIEESTFDKLVKLFWLDLSNNEISGFTTNVFKKKISNILLDGNRLICDESFNEFLTYLVAHKVRTFLPFQQEITCHGPEKYAGVRLKDLMMKKANETISEGTRLMGLPQHNNQHNLLSSFFPAVPNMNGLGANGAAIPLVNTLTNAFPAMRSIPGFGGNAAAGTGASSVPNKHLNDAIEEFTGPLVRFATGGQPVASDIEQLIRSIPNMVVNVPGFGDVDLSKMDPTMIQYVLNGGQIPGIDKSTLDSIVKQAMKKMHTAAEANLAGSPIDGQDKVLPPLEKLPSELVTQVMSGEPLPGLDKNQTKTIMEYYTHQMPVTFLIRTRRRQSLGMLISSSLSNSSTDDVHPKDASGPYP